MVALSCRVFMPSVNVRCPLLPCCSVFVYPQGVLGWEFSAGVDAYAAYQQVGLTLRFCSALDVAPVCATLPRKRLLLCSLHFNHRPALR